MRPIRLRTPTSAGMKNLQLEGKGVSDHLAEKQWNYVLAVFGITKVSAYETNLNIQRHLAKRLYTSDLKSYVYILRLSSFLSLLSFYFFLFYVLLLDPKLVNA
jgi:hypothetical protein